MRTRITAGRGAAGSGWLLGVLAACGSFDPSPATPADGGGTTVLEAGVAPREDAGASSDAATVVDPLPVVSLPKVDVACAGAGGCPPPAFCDGFERTRLADNEWTLAPGTSEDDDYFLVGAAGCVGKGLLSEVGDPASDGKVRRQLVRYYASGLTGFELDFDLWLDATLASYGVDSGSTIVRVEGVGGGEPRAASIDVNLAGGSVEILGVGYRRGITLPSKAWTHVHWEVRFGQPGTILVRLGSAVVLSDGAVATLTPAASAAAPPTAVQLTLGVENRKDTPTVRTRFDNVRFLAR